MLPIVLAEFIKYFEDRKKYHDMYGKEAGWILGNGVILISFLSVIFYHHAQLGCQKIGMRVRVACCSLVYRKVSTDFTH